MPTKPSTSSAASPPSHSVISSLPSDTGDDFNFSELCFFCAAPWDPAHKTGYLVQHNYVKEQLLDIAERREDEKGTTVMRRLQGISSLINVGARYHKKCYERFLMIPSVKPTHTPDASQLDSVFKRVCDYLENSEESRFLLSELRHIMGESCLASKTLYRKLKEKYGSDIYISQHRGKDTVIFFKDYSASKICADWFRDQDSVGEIEKKTIIKIAAEILRNDIEDFDCKNDSYPAAGEFLDTVVEDIPPLLNTFLGDLILTGKSANDERYFVKRNSIAHSIVSAVRPKSFISNLQLAVGTYIYRKSGSRLIIDLLAKLGVSASYHYIQQHEASTIMDPPQLKVGNYQIQLWLGNILNPEEWGWYKTNVLMLPTMTSKDPAPQNLLSMVFCSCTTDCRSARCGCRKVGLRCNNICKNCNGQSCSNPSLEKRALELENELEDETDEPRFNEDDIGTRDIPNLHRESLHSQYDFYESDNEAMQVDQDFA